MNKYKYFRRQREEQRFIDSFVTEVMYACLKWSKKGIVACWCWSMCLDGSWASLCMYILFGAEGILECKKSETKLLNLFI